MHVGLKWRTIKNWEKNLREKITGAGFRVKNKLVRIFFMDFFQSFGKGKPTVGVPMHCNPVNILQCNFILKYLKLKYLQGEPPLL